MKKLSVFTIFALLFFYLSNALAAIPPSPPPAAFKAASPGALGSTTPAAVYSSPFISKGPAAITSFTGTVSTSGASTTVTFTEAADAILAGYNATNPILGFTLIADGNTRYIQSWTNSTTCIVDSAVTLAASTPITSAQAPIAVFTDSDGVIKAYITAAGITIITGTPIYSNGETDAGCIGFYEDSDNGGSISYLCGAAAIGSNQTSRMPAEGGTFATTLGVNTAALGTSEIASGACAAAVDVTQASVASTDVIDWGFNGDPTGVTGYAASANGMLTIIAYPGTGHVYFKVCNNTAAAITPGAVTLNFKVRR
jgi:hypothetical protein